LKAVRSFIPTTNENWLYYEMKKISEVLGLDVSLNKEIEHYSMGSRSATSQPLYRNSFLAIIDTIQENHYHGNNLMVLKTKNSLFSKFSSPIKVNPFFVGLIDLVNKPAPSPNNQKNPNDPCEDRREELMYSYLTLMCFLKDNRCHKTHLNFKSNLTN
jgi:predicted metalloenzyme YecM